MNNFDISKAISDIAQAIGRDPHGGLHRFVLRELINERIIDTMPESMLDPFRPCPGDWTAIQIAYFDNGSPPPARKRYRVWRDGEKRLAIPRTKLRFGGNLKAWLRKEIAFKNKKLVAWEANFYCWTAADALEIVRDLEDQRYIDTSTVNLMKTVIDGCPDPDARFSVPLAKNAEGTRWMKEHVVVTTLDPSGLPERSVLFFPEVKLVTNQPFACTLPDGASFAQPVIRQARVGRCSDFGSWATEVLP